MTVDFAFAKAPSARVAYLRWTGPWSDKKIRSQFERVHRWVRANGARPGRWIFHEPGDRKWEAAVEFSGRLSAGDGFRIRTIPAATIAHVVFDPEVVSPRVVYHGLADWLRWRKKEKEIRSVGAYREVYSGNPWSDRAAWSKTDIQIVVRR
jgi:effector-binding domain-containing protein